MYMCFVREPIVFSVVNIFVPFKLYGRIYDMHGQQFHSILVISCRNKFSL